MHVQTWDSRNGTHWRRIRTRCVFLRSVRSLELTGHQIAILSKIQIPIWLAYTIIYSFVNFSFLFYPHVLTKTSVAIGQNSTYQLPSDQKCGMPWRQNPAACVSRILWVQGICGMALARQSWICKRLINWQLCRMNEFFIVWVTTKQTRCPRCWPRWDPGNPSLANV